MVKDTTNIAYNFLMANSKKFGIKEDNKSIVINSLNYNIKKDGTSGGIAITTAILSLLLDKKIPKKYTPIPDFIWLDVIKNVIKPLDKNEDYLRSEGFFEFNLSGHTEGKKFKPWQMADDQRM